MALFVFSSSAVFAFTSFVDFIENEAAETPTVGANVAVSHNVSATTITVAELGQATFALPFLPLINEAGAVATPGLYGQLLFDGTNTPGERERRRLFLF